MGADTFLACYGIRWEIDASNEDEVTLLEKRSDPRQMAAKRNGLDSWWGNTASEWTHYLLVGKLIGPFGWEGEHNLQILASEAANFVQEIKQKLLDAGFFDEPAWHYQFEPDR